MYFNGSTNCYLGEVMMVPKIATQNPGGALAPPCTCLRAPMAMVPVTVNIWSNVASSKRDTDWLKRENWQNTLKTVNALCLRFCRSSLKVYYFCSKKTRLLTFIIIFWCLLHLHITVPDGRCRVVTTLINNNAKLLVKTHSHSEYFSVLHFDFIRDVTSTVT